MPHTDPIDALDGSVVKAQSWSAVVERYSSIPVAQPLARLARAIAESPHADMLFPLTSMFDIRIYSTPRAVWNRECLLIQFDPTRSEFRFEFIEHTYTKPSWVKHAPLEEAFSAFIHCLALKRWFPVAEIERGTWSCALQRAPNQSPDPTRRARGSS